jgi:hypothetical protein
MRFGSIEEALAFIFILFGHGMLQLVNFFPRREELNFDSFAT